MQGELFFKWARYAIKSKKKLDQAKFQFDIVTAELTNKCRASPDQFGLQKVTDAAIIAAIKSSPEYQEAYETWLKAKAESGLLDRGVEAMEQRKRMIEVLITLHGQQYFAGPSVPRNLGEAWAEVAKKRELDVIKKSPTRIRKRTKLEC